MKGLFDGIDSLNDLNNVTDPPNVDAELPGSKATEVPTPGSTPNYSGEAEPGGLVATYAEEDPWS